MDNKVIEILDLANDASALLSMLVAVDLSELHDEGSHGFRMTLLAVSELLEKIKVFAGGG